MSFPLQINPCLSSLNALIVDVYNLVPQRFRRNFGVRPHPSTSPNSPSLDMEGFGEELEMQHNQEGELSGDEENRSNADNNGSNEDFNPTQNQLQRGTGDSSSHAHQLQEVNKMLGSRKFWVAMFALSVSYLIASLVDQLDVVFQYVGAIAGTMICFIFPAFFSLRIFERDSIQSNSIFIGLKKRSAAILLGVIGVFVMITSLFYSYFG